MFQDPPDLAIIYTRSHLPATATMIFFALRVNWSWSSRVAWQPCVRCIRALNLSLSVWPSCQQASLPTPPARVRLFPLNWALNQEAHSQECPHQELAQPGGPDVGLLLCAGRLWPPPPWVMMWKPPGEGPEDLSFTLEMGHTDCQKGFFNGGLVGW